MNSQSEKCKKDLLAKMVLEEHRDQELSKIVNKLLPDPKKTDVERPSPARKVPTLLQIAEFTLIYSKASLII